MDWKFFAVCLLLMHCNTWLAGARRIKYKETKDIPKYEATHDAILDEFDITCHKPTKQMEKVMKKWEEAPEGILVLHDDIYNKFREKITPTTTEYYEFKVKHYNVSETESRFSLHLADEFMHLNKCASYQFHDTTVVEKDGCAWKRRQGTNETSAIITTSSHSGCHMLSEEEYNAKETYNSVLSLAGRFSQRVYHFPADAVSSLAYFPNLHRMNNLTIHISYKDKYCLEWLSFVGITEDKFKIVDDYHVKSKEMFTPTYGLRRLPTVYQLEWLANTLRPKDFGDLNNPKLQTKRIVFLYRPVVNGSIKQTRGLYNRKEVRKVLQETGREVVDVPSEKYKTIAQQIDLYSTVDIIVGTHGAGFTFADFAPRDACLIEFNEAVHDPETFFMLHSLAQKRIHIVIPQIAQEPGRRKWRMASGTVNTHDVKWALTKCFELQRERRLKKATPTI
eukprot:m.10048 g.10048  ORF g.10048 m.10048 type:complete len:449 (+) comp4189_c0_seq1:441-1787(+)